jgi:hypothetical protein
MRKPIVARQDEFESWILDEVSVQARILRSHRLENRTGYATQMVDHRLDMLLVVLSRYTDRDVDALRRVAHDRDELVKAIREGTSFAAECERRYKEAMERAAAGHGCRGCGGTCCTGVGSEPCTCPDPDDEE